MKVVGGCVGACTGGRARQGYGWHGIHCRLWRPVALAGTASAGSSSGTSSSLRAVVPQQLSAQSTPASPPALSDSPSKWVMFKLQGSRVGGHVSQGCIKQEREGGPG